MPNHLYAVDSNRHPPQGASTATLGQVMKALGSDAISWVSVGGDVSGAPDNLSVTDLTIGSQATGDLLYFNGTNWVRRAATTNGFVLTLSGGVPTWVAAGSDIVVTDNTSGAFRVREGSNDYIRVDTTNGSELLTFGTAGLPRAILGGSTTQMALLLGNPDADNIVATPVTLTSIIATSSNSAAVASGLTIAAGDNFSTGDAGDFYARAGSTTGVGGGGDFITEAGNSGSGMGGTWRARTGQTSSPVDRLTISPNGEINLVSQSAAMPDIYFERYRYTANVNGSAQDVLTHVVTSDRVAWMRVVAIWRGADAADCAVMELLGGVTNDAGTVDEIGGATKSATGDRSGAAVTDAVEIRIVAGNAPDELKLQLFKNNANNYTVDVFVTYHEC